MLCSVVFGSPGTWTTTRQAPTSIRSPARLAGGNWLADMQGRPPEMQRGGPRCKNHSCFHAFGRHAQRRADMQGWPPEMQKKQPPLHVGLVLPRTTAERSFCISDSHPCMSALLFYYFTILLFYYFTILLFYYFTILLFYYFTPDTILPRPMFGVGRPRCKKKLACRPAYYFTILLLHSRYSTAAADVWGWPPEMQKQVFAARTATLACRPS